MLALPVLPTFRRPKETTGLQLELDQARLAAFISQAPLLYAILCVHVLFVSFSFERAAPAVLTLVAPAFLLVIIVSRAIFWLSRRKVTMSGVQATAALRSVNIFVVFLALLFTAWSFALYAYGDMVLRTQLVYAVAIADLVCIFAMAQTPKTALMLGGLTLPGFLLMLSMSGEFSTTIVAGGLMLVAIFLASMVLTTARDFEALVGAQKRAVELADENRRFANTDSLTGLSNRRAFFEALEHAIKREGADGALAMAVIDLDGFKPINDLFGHVVGDGVLRECAARIAGFATDGTMVARLGGDEFAIFLRGHYSEGDILALGAKLCAELKAPLCIADIRAGVSASIGFARYPQDAPDARQLYERADYALYFGKQNHRGEAVLFLPEHENQMRLTAKVEQSLRKADLDKEIFLEFQPLFSVTDQSIVAFEALARWKGPELGAVSPNIFIQVAERSEIIHALTRTVVRKALRAAHAWPRHVSLSFNLSIRDLLSQSALNQIVAIIASSGFDPARIDIEVTETALITDFDKAEAAILTLKRLGVKISLDDFGTGYSSLAYVHRLPLDKIKIERSFVQEMHGSSAARDIVKSMIGLCGNLNLHCVMEGVETSEQFDLLRAYGCNVVQGFLFSPPIAQDEVPAFIDEASRKSMAAQRVA